MKNDLLKYTWGLGIEHEMHIFHSPKLSQKNIQNYILFNSNEVINKILEDKENSKLNISYDDYIFIKNNVPFEKSGRKCNQKSVIEAVPFQMPEFITWDPFCSILKDRNIVNMVKDIVKTKERFYNILMNDKNTQRLVKKYGELSEYPFGMTRYLNCPLENKNGKYIFNNDKNGNTILLPEYNGSYHITFTLPFEINTTKNEFIKMHQNFCNQLQWLEPLMLTSYFTGDEYAPGSLKTRVRGSFRVMIIGWGNFAGSDIRLFKKGIGRYAKTPTYWRENLEFKDVDKLKPCYQPSPMALREGAISSLSSDFRTFGSTDPEKPMYRESGVGMTMPNGIEFRIFDHFQDKYIDHLLLFISLVAENSRVTKTKGYVYENKVWIEELHNIMKDGYKARISKKYVNLLRKKLEIKIDTESIIAIDIFKQIYKELIQKNKNGEWNKIFHCMQIPDYDDYVFPEINKKGWQFAFMTKANNEERVLRNFNILSNFLNNHDIILYSDFENAIKDIFGKGWMDDVEDLAYLYETLLYTDKNYPLTHLVKLIKNKDGTINKISRNIPIPKYNNFNNEIIDYFGKDLLKNIL